jgi:adenylate cyclase
LQRAGELAQKAIALDDSLPGPHATLGTVYLWQKQHAQAIAEAEQAIALDPNWATGYLTLGQILPFAGQPQEAIGMIEKGMRLNPLNPDIALFNLAFAYRIAGRYAEAIPP